MADPKKRKKKVPPKPAPPAHKDVGKKVWVSCRGARPCGSSNAEIRMKSRSPGGGWIVRYRCLNCGTSFFINS
jgi:hypothetical protein